MPLCLWNIGKQISTETLHKKWSFPLRISLVNVTGKLRIWSHLLKKSLMENFIFCAEKPVSFRAIYFCIHIRKSIHYTIFCSDETCYGRKAQSIKTNHLIHDICLVHLSSTSKTWGLQPHLPFPWKIKKFAHLRQKTGQR